MPDTAFPDFLDSSSDPPEDPPEDPKSAGLIGQIMSFLSGDTPEEAAESRFRKPGALGLMDGESVRLNDAEKEALAGLVKEGYAPRQVVPFAVGESGTKSGEYMTRQTGGGAVPEGTIQLAPMREGIGPGAEGNALNRAGGGVLMEEVAHDLTLSDTERSARIGRAVAEQYGANPDSVEALMRTDFSAESHYDRPHEKMAASLVPALQAIATDRDSSGVDRMQLDLAGSLLDAHVNVDTTGQGMTREQQALLDAIETRPPGVGTQ